MNDFILHMLVSIAVFSCGITIFHTVKSNTITSFFSLCFATASMYFFIKEDNPLYYVVFVSCSLFCLLCLSSVFLRISYRPHIDNFWRWIIYGRMFFALIFILCIIYVDTSTLNVSTKRVDIGSIFAGAGFTFLLSAISLRIKEKKLVQKNIDKRNKIKS